MYKTVEFQPDVLGWDELKKRHNENLIKNIKSGVLIESKTFESFSIMCDAHNNQNVREKMLSSK